MIGSGSTFIHSWIKPRSHLFQYSYTIRKISRTSKCVASHLFKLFKHFLRLLAEARQLSNDINENEVCYISQTDRRFFTWLYVLRLDSRYYRWLQPPLHHRHGWCFWKQIQSHQYNKLAIDMYCKRLITNRNQQPRYSHLWPGLPMNCKMDINIRVDNILSQFVGHFWRHPTSSDIEPLLEWRHHTAALYFIIWSSSLMWLWVGVVSYHWLMLVCKVHYNAALYKFMFRLEQVKKNSTWSVALETQVLGSSENV